MNIGWGWIDCGWTKILKPEELFVLEDPIGGKGSRVGMVTCPTFWEFAVTGFGLWAKIIQPLMNAIALARVIQKWMKNLNGFIIC
jgi:hypothetical protein